MHIEVEPVPFSALAKKQLGESSEHIRHRVTAARSIQMQRFSALPNIHYNAQMNAKQLRNFCRLEPAGESLIKNAMNKLGLSARAYDRILKVARTIADLGNTQNIQAKHIAEAIQYRSLDRDGWMG